MKLSIALHTIVLMSMLPIANAAATSECGSLENGYGPFDYRTRKDKLHIVEAYHFTPDVAALRSGNTGSIGGDLDYTLRSFPNHHRALYSMMNLAFKDRKAKPHGAKYTIDCYFDRAIRFAPNDGEVLVLYGVYLARTDRKQDAVTTLENAKKLERDNPNVYYNLGLVYFQMKNYPEALENAQRAYQLGSQLPALRNELKAAGKWQDTVSQGPASGKSEIPASKVTD